MSEQVGPDQRRRRGRPGRDQAAVIRRAVEVFNERGYDGTSVGELAKELGFSKSALYHHVPTKEHLLKVALDQALDGLTAALVAAETSSATSAAERLRDALTRSVQVLVAEQPAVTLLLRVRGNSAIELAALERRREIDRRLAALVHAAAAEGSVRADLPPDLISRLLFGMVNSLVEWYRPDGAIDADALAQAVTTVAFEGLG
ncbi:MAG: TetR/AcrR family transcriptional regulator [Marmoricola sp.]